MDRVRRISETVMRKYPSLFGSDFESNKKALESVAIVRSKFLKNQIAGYITRLCSADGAEEETPQDGEDKAPE